MATATTMSERPPPPLAAAETFESLVERHQDEIYRYLARVCRDDHLARDLLQETFLRAYRAYGRLDERAAHRAWLYRIAHNAFLNEIRRRKRSGGSLEEGTANEPRASRADDPAAIYEGREQLASVERAVGLLPQRQRTALVLRRLQELSYEDVGAALDCSAETARAHVYQAVKTLRRLMEDA